MKIAIQGHPTRGKEVIQILKDLGGKGSLSNFGYNEKMYYWINSNDIILESLINIKTKEEFNLYTLEEFETQFPFKVGDLCIYYSDIIDDNIVVKILGMTMENGCIMYEVGNRSITEKHSYIYRKRETLRPYKEMKEKRNVTLTLDKAKEWYKKGGELKEIALQAFTEKELNPLPRSWEEYCRKYEYTCLSTRYTNISLKYDALLKLEQLRDCWRNGWVPNWSDRSEKWCIALCGNELSVSITTIIPRFLTFPTKEMAQEFFKCFRDLIEKAGDLI